MTNIVVTTNLFIFQFIRITVVLENRNRYYEVKRNRRTNEITKINFFKLTISLLSITYYYDYIMCDVNILWYTIANRCGTVSYVYTDKYGKMWKKIILGYVERKIRYTKR